MKLIFQSHIRKATFMKSSALMNHHWENYSDQNNNLLDERLYDLWLGRQTETWNKRQTFTLLIIEASKKVLKTSQSHIRKASVIENQVLVKNHQFKPLLQIKKWWNLDFSYPKMSWSNCPPQINGNTLNCAR